MSDDWFDTYAAGDLAADRPVQLKCPPWCETDHAAMLEYEADSGRVHLRTVLDGVQVYQLDDPAHRVAGTPAVYVDIEDQLDGPAALQFAAALMNAVDIVSGVRS